MKKNSELHLLKQFLKQRRVISNSSVSYWMYFILIVFLVGIIGSLISAFPAYSSGNGILKATSLSLVGYAVVMLCSSSIELIFIELKDKEKKYSKIKNAIVMLGIGLVIFSMIMGLVTYMVKIEILRLVLSLFACSLALYFWWITNSMSSSVIGNRTPPNIGETTGGESEGNLSGSTEGYQV